jgi:hypothetical protein
MRLVIIESPYSGNVERNLEYLHDCLLDSIKRCHEAPFASHAFYTQILKDEDPVEREHGIRYGLAWAKHAHATVVYCDLGLSEGMARGIRDAAENGRTLEFRWLRGKWAT